MSAHYSKYLLNTYAGTPYFRAHIPEGYPIYLVLRASRAHRRLPLNIQELSKLARQWSQKHESSSADDALGTYYDEEGYELNPATKQRLTDEEIDAQWQDEEEWDQIEIEDIPIPEGGFADPETWTEPKSQPEEDDEEAKYKPTEEKLLAAIKSHGREYVAKYYGVEDTGDDQTTVQTVLQKRKG